MKAQLQDVIPAMFHFHYQDEIRLNTINANRQFTDNGTFGELDELVNTLEKKYAPNTTKSAKVKETSATIAKQIGVPVTVGALVSVGVAFFKEGAEYVQQNLPWIMAKGALYAGTVSTATTAAKAFFKNKLGDIGKKFGSGRKHLKTLLDMGKHSNQYMHDPKLFMMLSLAKTAYLGAIDDDNTVRARHEVLQMIKYPEQYKKKFKIISAGNAVSAAYGTAKYWGLGTLYNIFSPINAELGLMALIGGTSELGVNKIEDLEKVMEQKTLAEYAQKVTEMDQKDRKKLIGGLVKMWYPGKLNIKQQLTQ